MTKQIVWTSFSPVTNNLNQVLENQYNEIIKNDFIDVDVLDEELDNEEDNKILLSDSYKDWFLIKVSYWQFDDIDDWLNDNVSENDYEKIGWESGCSSNVAVLLKNSQDALIFKMMFA